jgi:hypothetical protein
MGCQCETNGAKRESGQANKAGSHVMSSCQLPPPRPCINSTSRRCSTINSGVPDPHYELLYGFSVCKCFSSSLEDRPPHPSAALAWINLDFHGVHSPWPSPGSLHLPGALSHYLPSNEEHYAASKRKAAKRLSMASSSAPNLCFSPWFALHVLLAASAARASTSRLLHPACLPVRMPSHY